MSLVKRFLPPAHLPDLNFKPGQLKEWHKAVSAWFDDSISQTAQRVKPGPFQYYNPARFDPRGFVIEQAVTWNAFPKELLRLFGRTEALKKADEQWTLARYYSVRKGRPVRRRDSPELFKFFVRPHTEYCEWLVTRDPKTNAIQRVTFTSEPPELWFAAFGDEVPWVPHKSKFSGDRQAVARRYERFVGHRVSWRDLIAPQTIIDGQGKVRAIKNKYNIYNKWNTTDGIVHLCAPPNTLFDEIGVPPGVSMLRTNAAGRLLVEPEALICCTGNGQPNRNSDPTISAAVNAAARLGAYLTLKNPVGLYMDHIDLAGWEAPDKKGVTDCIHIMRGTKGMIARLVVEVPKARGFDVSDITIGGEPINYGGQIAECITVKIVGIATLPNKPVRNAPVESDGQYVLDTERGYLVALSDKPADQPPPRFELAYVGQGTAEITATANRPSRSAKKKRRQRRKP